MTELVCTKCGQAKPEDDFAKSRFSKTGRFCWCRQCKNEYYKSWHDLNPRKAIASARRWKKANPERVRVHRQNYKLRAYGATQDQVDTANAQQVGRCAICSNERDLVIDHDHRTKTFRGLLCHQCNKGIGLLGDDPSVVLRAFNYLTKHKTADKCAI